MIETLKGNKCMKDYKKFVRAVVIIIINGLLIVPLPHTYKSLYNYLLPPIQVFDFGVLELSGLPAVIISYWCYREVVKSNVINMYRHGIFMTMLVAILYLYNNMSIVKTPYFLLQENLNATEVYNTSLYYSNNRTNIGNEQHTLNLTLEIENFKKVEQDFKIALIPPESLKEFVPQDTLYNEQTFHLKGKEVKRIQAGFALDRGVNGDAFSMTRPYGETEYYVILYNENGQVTMKRAD